jgi:hypothetical protein
VDVGKLIDKFGASEAEAFSRLFVAPVVPGGSVCLRVHGVACPFVPEDASFEGWGVFRVISSKQVRLEEPATPALVRRYLDRLTPVELVVAAPSGATRPAVAAHPAGSRVRFDGQVALHLVKRAQLFRHVTARFDGFNFWFDRVHPGRNPAAAAYLRKALERDLEPEGLDHAGLLPADVDLYAGVLAAERRRREHPDQRRLRLALGHGGGVLDAFERRDDTFQVTYEIDGRRHVSVVHAADLRVLSAGICLSEEDEKFDLQSLVGVMREARDAF